MQISPNLPPFEPSPFSQASSPSIEKIEEYFQGLTASNPNHQLGKNILSGIANSHLETGQQIQTSIKDLGSNIYLYQKDPNQAALSLMELSDVKDIYEKVGLDPNTAPPPPNMPVDPFTGQSTALQAPAKDRPPQFAAPHSRAKGHHPAKGHHHHAHHHPQPHPVKGTPPSSVHDKK